MTQVDKLKRSHEKPSLTLMVGLPRSGKTTWVQENKKPSVVSVSADDLLLLIHGQAWSSEAEPMVWYFRNMMLKSLMVQGHNILIDETNTTRLRRSTNIKLAKKYGYSVDIVWVDTPLEVCEERAIFSKREELLPVIQRMSDHFERPNIEEGYDNLLYYPYVRHHVCKIKLGWV